MNHVELLNSRSKRLANYSYKLAEGQYALDMVIPEVIDLDEKRMSVWIPFADGNAKDGVGDVTEVAGLRLDRHMKNPVCLFDHGKSVTLPIGLSEDPETSAYTVEIDATNRTARGNIFFYQGKGLKIENVNKDDEYDHAIFCEQIYDMLAKKFIRGGSFGYQVIKAMPLQADYDSGVPQGLHLFSTLLLEFGPTIIPANKDTVRKMLCLDTICGKPKSPAFVKSLTPYAGEKVVQIPGDLNWLKEEEKEPEHKSTPVPFTDDLSKTDVPHSRWKPGAGAIKAQGMRPDEEKYRSIETGDSPMRKGKSFSALRKKYRRMKSVRRRTRKSISGVSIVYVARKDIDRSRAMAEKMGLDFQHMGEKNGTARIKLSGSDNAIDEVAREFGMRAKSLSGRKKYITHNGSEWVVHSESGRVLGKHPTKEKAEAQLRAVEANKGKALLLRNDRTPKPGKLTRTWEQTRRHFEGLGLTGVGMHDDGTVVDDTPENRQILKQQRYVFEQKCLCPNCKTGKKCCSQGKAMTQRWVWNVIAWGPKIPGNKYGNREGPRRLKVVADSKEEATRLALTELPDNRKDVVEVTQYAAVNPDSNPIGVVKSMKGKKGYISEHGGETDPNYSVGWLLKNGYKDDYILNVLILHYGMTRARAKAFLDEYKRKFGNKGQKAQPSSDISPEKACQILKDGKVNGEPLTDAQRGMFGAACGRKKTMTKSKNPQPWEESNRRNAERDVKKKIDALWDAYQEGRYTKDEYESRRNAIIHEAEWNWKVDFRKLLAKYNVKGKAMAKEMTLKVKSAPDGLEEVPLPDDGGTHDAIDEELEEADVEPYSAQVLRRRHDHSKILLEEYDEMMRLLEEDEVKANLQEKLEHLAEDLDEIEELFAKKHPDGKPLEGAGEKDLEDEDEDESEAEEADSEEEELPTPEEAVEGMNVEREENVKALRVRYKKGLEPGEEAEDEEKEKAMKKKKGIEPGEEAEKEEKEKALDAEGQIDKEDEEVEIGMKALEPHEKEKMGEASEYLKDLSTEENFGDEHRMKSYHYHKALGDIAGMEDEEKGYKSGDAMQAMEGQDNEFEVQHPGEKALHPHRKAAHGASMFFKSLSQERAFGDMHREKALAYHKALDPIAHEDEEVEVTEGDGMGGEALSGEMGEKGLLATFKQTFEVQGKAINDLNSKITRLLS